MMLRHPRPPGTKPATARNKFVSGLTRWKVLVDYLQAIATIIALCLGGWWFLNQKLMEGKLNEEIHLDTRLVTPRAAVVAVRVKLTNAGVVPVKCHYVHVTLSQVVPPKEETLEHLGARLASATQRTDVSDMLWPKIAEAKSNDEILLNPGESDEYDFDLVIPSDVKTVQVLTNVARDITSDLSWSQKQLYDVKQVSSSQGEK
ncbi:hypothetical protein PQR71_07590 [Paraburkholderia fungorum]|uniref:hypothetical protein n=1 Tax=Paraburkholderia fungorum TaxID=134537 RepID=UPI0038BBEEC7